VHIPIELDPAPPALPAVEYRWDVDTDILSAQLVPRPGTGAHSGSVEVGGDDGSWLILEVNSGRLNGIEVAVWPEVRKDARLAPPEHIEPAAVRLAAHERDGVAGMEVSTAVVAESDAAERVIHFRLGQGRPARTIRVGTDLLVDLDARARIAGLWMLNVPPFPAES